MNIVVFSSIFSDVRNKFKTWGDSPYAPVNFISKFISGIVSCPMCFGFHGGWFLSISVFSPTLNLYGIPYEISWFFDAVLSSGAVWAINSAIEWFEENRPNNN
jgi:hypothetical protein